jgi:hypothetical protein
MFDLGFLGVEKDFPTKQKSSLHIENKGSNFNGSGRRV